MSTAASAGANQNAAVLGDQRKHVAWRDDVARIPGWIDRHGDGVGPVVGGYPRRHPFPRLDRDGEGCAVTRLVLGGHRRQAQLSRTLCADRQADQAARMLGHEVDLVGRGKLGRDDDIALVLAVLGVHQDVGTAIAGVLDNILDGRNGAIGTHAVCLQRAR